VVTRVKRSIKKAAGVVLAGPAVERGARSSKQVLWVLVCLQGEGLPTRPVCPGGACLLEPNSPHARVFFSDLPFDGRVVRDVGMLAPAVFFLRSSLGSCVLHAHAISSQPTGDGQYVLDNAEENAIRKMRVGVMLEWVNLVFSRVQLVTGARLKMPYLVHYCG
jgi:hypothetical protein